MSDQKEERFVPIAALKEERAEKKQLREELRQYREWQVRLAQRLQGLPVTEHEVLAFNPAAPSPATPEAEGRNIPARLGLIAIALRDSDGEAARLIADIANELNASPPAAPVAPGETK